MTGYAEGAPCWADTMLPDLAAGKRFYGALFGWTFGDPDPERHDRTTAYLDGEPAAALAAKPDDRMPTVWNVYFAVRDAEAAARRVAEAGGQLFMGPMAIDRLGTMLMAADPSGGVFAAWEADGFDGFGARDRPGAFCWTELNTRDPAAADPFYRAVLGHHGEQIGRAGGDFDYEVWHLGGDPDGPPVGGRMRTAPGVPAEPPAHFEILFAVSDCDVTADRVRELGGRVVTGPEESPYGRLAAVADDQGARFTVIDLSKAAPVG